MRKNVTYYKGNIMDIIASVYYFFGISGKNTIDCDFDLEEIFVQSRIARKRDLKNWSI